MFEKDTLPIVGEGDCGYEGSVSYPIFQTSTFSGGEFSYSRCSNPTRFALERELALLEGGKYGYAFSSGLAAINAVFSLLKQGDHVIVSDDLYGGTYRLITKVFEKYGIDFAFVDMGNAENVANAFQANTVLVFAESPTNPMMKIVPLREIAQLCKEHGAVFAVDNTFLTPYFQNPLQLGADIAVHSATKFLSGHHDTLAGVVITSDENIAQQLSMLSMTLGNMLSPFDCWLTLRGLRTLPLRMKRHQENAFAVARFLETLPEIDKVIYPGLESHQGRSLCASQARGFGGVVSFTVKDVRNIKRLIAGGRIIKFAESLGGFRSLITYPLTQTHSSIPREKREKIGITDKLLRLSVGLEDSEDIKNDILFMLSRSDFD